MIFNIWGNNLYWNVLHNSQAISKCAIQCCEAVLGEELDLQWVFNHHISSPETQFGIFFEHYHRMNCAAGYLRSSLGEEQPSRRWRACLPTTISGPASTRSRWGEQALIRVSIFRFSQLIHPGCLVPWNLSKPKSFQRLSKRFSLHAEWQVSTARQWQMKNWSLADIDHKE